MNYITATYFQAAQNHSALLLQHYQYQNIPICLLALSAGKDTSQGKAAAYLTGQLLQWFRSLPFKRIARNPDKHLSYLESSLQSLLQQACSDLISCGLISGDMSLSLSGILCADDHFLLFHRGGQGIYLLNQSFNKSHLQCLTEHLAVPDSPQTLTLCQGILQQDVVILFATDTLCRQLTDQEIRECLYVRELHGAKQAGRHLQELGRRGEALGGRDMAAAVLLTCL